MGATNSIKETNISLQLEGKVCPQCEQKFTEQEIDNRNYDIWFDTTNDVELIPMSEVKETSLYFPFGRTGYQLTIWIRSIEHSYCSAQLFEICEDCDERFLRKEMIEFKDNYYCQPCYRLIDREKDHE